MQLHLRESNKQYRQLEETLEVQRANFRNEMRAHEEASEIEINVLKTQNRKLQIEAPIVKERVDLLKEQLRELVISEDHYYELKRIPEGDRSLRDWLLVKLYDVVDGYRGNYDRIRKEVESLRVENTILADKVQRLDKDLTHNEAHTGSYVKDLERKYADIVAENKRIHMVVDQMKKLADENSDKAIRFDEISREYKRALEEKTRLINQVEAQITQINQLTHDREDARVLLDGRNKEFELLIKDKQYLTKQNVQLQDKIQRLEDRNDRLEVEIIEAKNAAQNYLNRLLDSKTEKTSDFEEKFRKELQNLRDRNDKEVDDLKANLNEIHEKRVQYLKESKEESELKLSRLEQDYKDKSEGYDSLLVEFRMMQSRLEEQLQGLRGELRIKSENLERTHNVYEDTIKALRHSKAENELLKEKVDVLRQEFYKSETKCTQENAELRAEMAVARENLQQYALIEQELDEAIKNQDVEGFQAPTTSKRRIKQSLELARQVKDKQKLLEAVRADNSRLESEYERMSSELDLCKNLLNNTEQPYAYLVTQIETKEREISELKRQIARTQQKYSELGGECELLLRKNEELEADIKQILTKRDAIESLKGMLTQLVDEGKETQVTTKLKETITNKQGIPNNTGAPGWFNTLKKRLNK